MNQAKKGSFNMLHYILCDRITRQKRSVINSTYVYVYDIGIFIDVFSMSMTEQNGYDTNSSSKQNV